MIAALAEPAPQTNPVTTLRVLTQNVWGHNNELGATAVGLRESGADVLLLQELDGPIRELPKVLKEAYPYQADCTSITEWCSMAILSKRPILRWSHHEPAWKPPVYDRLAIVRATIDGGAAGPVDIATTHLMHPDHGGPTSEQTAQFQSAVSDLDTRRGIIGGDFNSGPGSFALGRIDRGLPVARRTHWIATWPNRMPWGEGRSRWPFPFLSLDQIYAGRGWRVASAERGPSTGSDHYGVVATLAYSR
jgi:endonuclease/exonuclease/phosphatase (EEP) superfamily protein YafD